MINETPTTDELMAFKALSGLDKKAFVNTNGKRYRELGLKDRLADMSDEELFGLISGDGLLVKRPLLVGEDFVLVGFKEKDWAERV